MNASLVFQGIRTSIAKKFSSFVIVQGVGCLDPCVKPPLNDHADVSEVLHFVLIVLLLQYFVHANSKCFGESEHLLVLGGTFDAQRCDKYQSLMCWPIIGLRTDKNIIINKAYILQKHV